MPPENQTTTNAPAEPKEATPQSKSVDLFGKTFELPTEIADAIVPLRDAYKADKNDTLDSRLSSIEERIRADVEAKEKAEFDKKIEQYKKDNDIDNIKALIESQYQEQIKSLSETKDSLKSKIVDGSIKDAIRSVDGIISDAVPDAMIIYKSQFDVDEEGTVINKSTNAPILNDKGGRINVADHVKQFISTKPQFLLANAGNGTGATGAADLDPRTGVRQMTRKDYESIMSEGGMKAKQVLKSIQEGKTTLVND